jgi:nucleoside-diphosphate-sugar epimerase
MRAFIIGGTGQIGRAIGAKLLADGWDVALSSRGQRPCPTELTAIGAEIVQLDRDQPGELARALADGADAVIDTIAYDEGHAGQLLSLEGSIGQLIVISSVSVYRDEAGRTIDEASENGFPDLPDPITEDQPTVAPGPETYSTRKVAIERLLLDKGRRPVTILRPCAIHGPWSNHPREWWFVKRMLDGRRAIPIIVGGRSRFHTSAVANIAEMAAVALGQPAKRVLNIGDPSVTTVWEIGSIIADAMNWGGELIDIGDPRPASTLGWTPWSVPAPITVSNEAATRLGYKPVTDYATAAPQICEWLRQQPTEGWEERFPVLAGYWRPMFDYAGEDALLKTRAT